MPFRSRSRKRPWACLSPPAGRSLLFLRRWPRPSSALSQGLSQNRRSPTASHRSAPPQGICRGKTGIAGLFSHGRTGRWAFRSPTLYPRSKTAGHRPVLSLSGTVASSWLSVSAVSRGRPYCPPGRRSSFLPDTAPCPARTASFLPASRTPGIRSARVKGLLRRSFPQCRGSSFSLSAAVRSADK